jgi:preprotein translocase subunit SecD
MLQFPLWKKVTIILIALFGVLYAAPNVTGPWQPYSGYPTWAPGKPLNLGLDLRGGAHLLVRVRTEEVVADRIESTIDGLRAELRDERVRASGFDGNAATRSLVFNIRDAEDADGARRAIFSIAPDFEVTNVSDTRFRLEMPDTLVEEINQRTMAQSLEVVTRRVNALGLTEPTIQRQGTDRILIQVPGIDDTEELKEILNAQARLAFHLVDLERMSGALQSGRAPPGSMILPSEQTNADGEPLREWLITRRAYVSGENLDNAQATFQEGQPVVAINFDAAGAQRFGEVTQENLGGQLAIVLDNKVISAPTLRVPILDGNAIITGGFTIQTANQLALLLRAGALPAQMDVIEERTVGPGLGQDSIDAGSLASIIGLIAVVFYMAISYGRFGVYANVALLLNLILLLGVLSALGATLTLPWIAGIVLTVGMAVDANVLIFERIREEARNGRTPINAIDAGYRQALTTIIDANLTTLIAAVLLFAFGSGPIRGFAVTLAIGIVTSMFTAIMVTRLLVVTYVRSKRPDSLPIAGDAAVGASRKAEA